MKNLIKIIENENNVSNLKNIAKMAKKDGLENIYKLTKNRIKLLAKKEQEEIAKEFEREEEKSGWKKNIHHCANCGKEIDFEFKSKANWGWKIGKNIFCSYSCYSKAFEAKERRR